jgi:MAF protein
MSSPWIVLASGSPRRRTLLEGAGVPVRVRPCDVDETPLAGEDARDYARRLARAKADSGRAALQPGDPGWVLGSDTVVTLDGAILGKPDDATDACRMLRQLSGRTHHVVTTWALVGPDTVVGESVTAVTFRALSDDEIGAYVETGEPMDKAGAYAIQGGAGAFVSARDGDWSAVVGLPVGQVCAALVRGGIVPAGAAAVAPRRAAVMGRVEAAARAAGRDPSTITVVAVGKKHPVACLEAALRAGQRDLGESYVQEWEAKAAALDGAPAGREAIWHFVGRLQRNKAKHLAERIDVVHGIDDLRTAETLGRRADAVGRVVPVMLQVNLAGEASKGGVGPAEVESHLDAIAGMRGVAPRGLMTLPPHTGVEGARVWFDRLAALRAGCDRPDRSLPWLSMGMSGDLEAAVAAGATHVRIGTDFFGPRP